MEIQMIGNGEKRGVIPYPILPSFDLLLRQSGFQTRWDTEENIFYFYSEIAGKKIYLTSGKSGTSEEFRMVEAAKEIFIKMSQFLSAAHAEVMVLEDSTPLIEPEALCIQLCMEQTDDEQPPQIIVFQCENDQTLIDSLKSELDHTGFEVTFEERDDKPSPSPFLEVLIRLPEKAKKYDDLEKIAFYLTSGILAYFQGSQPLAYLSHLPSDVLLNIMPEPARHPVQIDQQRVLNSPEQSSQTQKPLETQPLQAEIYFDYMVFPSDLENGMILIIGHLYMKNTGTEYLTNPIICLRSTPADSVKIRGQILPATMIETLSVQGAEGPIGWRYMEGEGFEHAHERGELWIQPIQQMRIGPLEIESFQHFQISISKPKAHGLVKVEAIVFFQEQGLSFPANNRIAFSF